MHVVLVAQCIVPALEWPLEPPRTLPSFSSYVAPLFPHGRKDVISALQSHFELGYLILMLLQQG